jgi:hypothetical protein
MKRLKRNNVAVELTLITHFKFHLQLGGSFAQTFIWPLFIQQKLGYQKFLTVSEDTNNTIKYLYSTTPFLVGSFRFQKI